MIRIVLLVAVVVALAAAVAHGSPEPDPPIRSDTATADTVASDTGSGLTIYGKWPGNAYPDLHRLCQRAVALERAGSWLHTDGTDADLPAFRRLRARLAAVVAQYNATADRYPPESLTAAGVPVQIGSLAQRCPGAW